MHIGASIFPTAYAIPMAELGPALEERGFESIWVAEHSQIPASRQSPWPGGGDLPQVYYDTLDPFVALTAAAVNTSKIKLATGIALVAQRDPIHLAKEAASLDVVSNGRLLLGVGAGWNIEEMEQHGTDPTRRFGRMRETVEACQALWGNDVASYEGDQVRVEPTHQNPKPVQAGGPPVHVGGVFPGGMQRAVRYGNGWIPIGGRGGIDYGAWATAFDEACAEAGRDRNELELTIYGVAPKPEALEDLAAAGVDRAILTLPSEGAEAILPRLDRWAGLIGAS